MNKTTTSRDLATAVATELAAARVAHATEMVSTSEILSMVPRTVPAGAFGRSWLAISRDGAPLQIAVLGPTESEARDRFTDRLRVWAPAMIGTVEV